ncbi:hypothetical protein [Paludibacterium purpuratum]|uniref:C1q domain-containing protein n=1 Tax=Paludibacterium purpuratum TaxID=1144873 RepID=A0A4R7B5N7_9NEIS|nr:hypothetical protein [Paludibacterium purpuratum]TDR79990.1 hypothetical protein DFP86_106130 [Paludibacterium purpuratum]
MATIVTGSGVSTPQLNVSGTATFGSTPNVTTPQSMVQLNTANGYGSTNVMIRRFSNMQVNQGTDISYIDSTVNGASFSINTAGVYSISYTDQFSGTNANMGLSLNSSQLTTPIYLLNAANMLAANTVYSTNTPMSCGWTGWLPVGAVIRAHNNGAVSGTFTQCCQFTIARVA